MRFRSKFGSQHHLSNLLGLLFFLLRPAHYIYRHLIVSDMASSLSISTPISNTSFSVTLSCWKQNPPEEPQLPPLTYIECKQAIRDIPMGDKALAPLSFSRDPGAGFTCPYTWDFGDCAIAVDVLQKGDTERSTFASIFKRAFDIAVECVIKPPHFGGQGFVGENERLKVSVIAVHPAASSLSLVEPNVVVPVDGL